MRWLAIPVLALLLLAGCSSPPSASGITPTKDEQGRYLIDLTGDNKISPAQAKVPVGATVVWKVGPGGFHDVTSDAGAPQAFTSDSQYPNKMKEGQEFAFTFTKAGTYTYKCAVHGAMMSGRLVVE